MKQCGACGYAMDDEALSCPSCCVFQSEAGPSREIIVDSPEKEADSPGSGHLTLLIRDLESAWEEKPRRLGFWIGFVATWVLLGLIIAFVPGHRESIADWIALIGFAIFMSWFFGVVVGRLFWAVAVLWQALVNSSSEQSQHFEQLAEQWEKDDEQEWEEAISISPSTYGGTPDQSSDQDPVLEDGHDPKTYQEETTSNQSTGIEKPK